MNHTVLVQFRSSSPMTREDQENQESLDLENDGECISPIRRFHVTPSALSRAPSVVIVAERM
jgi:hypothetical protein